MTWWKILAAALLFYALIFGMLVPLKPGLKSVDKNSFSSNGIIECTINGYNTRFLETGKVIRAWIKLEDEKVLQASQVTPLTNKILSLVFELNGHLPGQKNIANASIIVDDSEDKTMVLPSALFIEREGEESTGPNLWSDERPDGLSAKSGIYFPYRNILVETIRNLFYHVAIWFAMFILLIVSVVKSIKYLRTKNLFYDAESDSLVRVGILFGMLGLMTGSLWAKFTWGTFWTTDVKLNMAAVSMLIYLGYLLLRSSIEDRERRATVSSAYSIFAFAAIIPLLFIVPRITDSLHPGNGGNPALGGEDLDNTMRIVFYPAIIGLTLTGLWMAQLKWRIEKQLLKKLGL